MIIKDLIFLDQDLNTQDEVFELVGQKALELNKINDLEGFKDALFKREAEIPTSVGYDIAIPHCRNHSVNEPLIAFIRLKEAIKWSQLNDDMAQMIFLIGIPETSDNGNLHLKYLSTISRKLMHESFREELLNSNDATRIFELMDEINQTIGA